MKTILALSLLLVLTGCSTTNISKLTQALSKDPAIVSVKVSSVYGTVNVVRVGTTTNSVTVSPDGTVTVNKPPP